jgi:hypothetical protein
VQENEPVLHGVFGQRVGNVAHPFVVAVVLVRRPEIGRGKSDLGESIREGRRLRRRDTRNFREPSLDTN